MGRDVSVDRRLAALAARIDAGSEVSLEVEVLTSVGDGVRRRSAIPRCVRRWAHTVPWEALEVLTEVLARAEEREVARLEHEADARVSMREAEGAASATVGLAWFAYCHDALPTELRAYGALEAVFARLRASCRFLPRPAKNEPRLAMYPVSREPARRTACRVRRDAGWPAESETEPWASRFSSCART